MTITRQIDGQSSRMSETKLVTDTAKLSLKFSPGFRRVTGEGVHRGISPLPSFGSRRQFNLALGYGYGVGEDVSCDLIAVLLVPNAFGRLQSLRANCPRML